MALFGSPHRLAGFSRHGQELKQKLSLSFNLSVSLRIKLTSQAWLRVMFLTPSPLLSPLDTVCVLVWSSKHTCSCLIGNIYGNCVRVLVSIATLAFGMPKTLRQTIYSKRISSVVPHERHCNVLTWRCKYTVRLNILKEICEQKKASNRPVWHKSDLNMYLKAACSEIPVPRQRGGPRLDRCSSSIQQRQGAGTRVHFSSLNSCPAGALEDHRPQEQHILEDLLHVQNHFFQASPQPCASMVYR